MLQPEGRNLQSGNRQTESKQGTADQVLILLGVLVSTLFPLGVYPKDIVEDRPTFVCGKLGADKAPAPVLYRMPKLTLKMAVKARSE